MESMKVKNELQQYFGELLRLAETGEEFPVNLEKVWPLAYTTKGNAVRDLREGGTEGVDYQFFIKNDKNSSTDYQHGGRPSKDYRITVPCMEWLIARKHRPVFEVYRRVFHKAVKAIKPLEALRPSVGISADDMATFVWPQWMRADREMSVKERTYYPYYDVLDACDLSRRSGSVWKRKRNYPSEFVWKDGIWWVSFDFARMIDHNWRAKLIRNIAAERSERLLDFNIQ